MSAKSKSASSAETRNVWDRSSSSSSLQDARDQSPAYVTSYPTVKNPSPDPEKIKATRTVKPLELEAELNLAQEELKKANEKLVLLVDELEASRNEGEKIKKVSESLASALHEVSLQARDAKEALLSIRVENEKYEKQIEDMKTVMEAKDEKYESVINALTLSTERPKHDYHVMKAEMERKELYLTNALKRSEEEKSTNAFEINRLGNLVKKLEKEARGATSEKEATKKAKTGERENELRKKVSENDDDLRKRGRALEEALARNSKREEGNGDDSSEMDYDMLPKWTSFMQINGEEEEEDEDFSDGDIEMWEKDAFTESEGNGVMKKKKPLLAKIGRLLKKGSAN